MKKLGGERQKIELIHTNIPDSKLNQWTKLLRNTISQTPKLKTVQSRRQTPNKSVKTKSDVRSVEKNRLDVGFDLRMPIILNSGIHDSTISKYSVEHSEENPNSELKVIFAQNRDTKLSQSAILQKSDPNSMKKSKSTNSTIFISPKMFKKVESKPVDQKSLIPTPRSDRGAPRNHQITKVGLLPKSTMGTVLDLSAVHESRSRDQLSSAEKSRKEHNKKNIATNTSRSRSPLINIVGFDSPVGKTLKKDIRRIPAFEPAKTCAEYYLKSHHDIRRLSAECNQSSDGGSSLRNSRIGQQTIDHVPSVQSNRLRKVKPMVRLLDQSQGHEFSKKDWKRKLLTREQSTQTASADELFELQSAYSHLQIELQQKLSLIEDLFSRIEQDQQLIAQLEETLSRYKSTNALDEFEEQEMQLRYELYNPKMRKVSEKAKKEASLGANTSALNKSAVSVAGAPLFVSNSNVQISISQPSAAAIPAVSLDNLAELFQDSQILQEDFQVLCNQLLKESGNTFRRFWIELREEISNLRQDVAILKHEKGLLKSTP